MTHTDRKNQVREVRNPNSPEAIAARLNNTVDTSAPQKILYIDDPSAASIRIDYTTSNPRQDVGFASSGTNGSENSRKYVRTHFVHKDGQVIAISYYIDSRTQQWLVVKGPVSPLIYPEIATSNAPYPRATYSGMPGGFYSSAPGEAWRNEGKSVDKLLAAQKKQFKITPLDPHSNEKQDKVGDLHNPNPHRT